MVITLKDGSVVTLFDRKEAIDIIDKELYDFIVGDEETKRELKHEIAELDLELDSYKERCCFLSS